MAGLCLADLRPIAGLLERQMRGEEGMSKRCECQCFLEEWEGGWKRLKLLHAGCQWEHDRDNLFHTYVAGSWASGCVFMVFANAEGLLIKVCFWQN